MAEVFRELVVQCEGSARSRPQAPHAPPRKQRQICRAVEPGKPLPGWVTISNTTDAALRYKVSAAGPSQPRGAYSIAAEQSRHMQVESSSPGDIIVKQGTVGGSRAEPAGPASPSLRKLRLQLRAHARVPAYRAQ